MPRATRKRPSSRKPFKLVWSPPGGGPDRLIHCQLSVSGATGCSLRVKLCAAKSDAADSEFMITAKMAYRCPTS